MATIHQLPTYRLTLKTQDTLYSNHRDAEPAPATLGELCRDEYGLAKVNGPASRCTITSRCMAAEPKRACSVLTINQVLLLGHKLHVGLGKTYFKKLYLPKIISRNKPKPFFHFKTPSVQAKRSSDCQTEGRQVSPHPLSSSHKRCKHLHGARGWKSCPAGLRYFGVL